MEAIILVNSKSGIKAALSIKVAIERKGHSAYTVDERNRTKYYDHQADIVVRWGTFGAFPLNGAIEVNPGAAIIQVENKAYSRNAMQKGGIAVPKTWFNINKAEIPFIVRPEIHSLGRQFRIVKKEQDISFHRHVPNLYCSAIFPKVSEFRAHTWNDSVFSLWDKNILPDEILANQASTRRKWTHINEPSGTIHDKVISEAIRACQIFGLTTGGVDIMVDKDQNIAICEINTMPMVKTDFLADLYADQIIKNAENG